MLPARWKKAERAGPGASPMARAASASRRAAPSRGAESGRSPARRSRKWARWWRLSVCRWFTWAKRNSGPMLSTSRSSRRKAGS